MPSPNPVLWHLAGCPKGHLFYAKVAFDAPCPGLAESLPPCRGLAELLHLTSQGFSCVGGLVSRRAAAALTSPGPSMCPVRCPDDPDLPAAFVSQELVLMRVLVCDLCIFTRPTLAQEALRTRNTRLSGGDKVLPVASQGPPSPGSRSSDHLPPTPSGAEAKRPTVDTGCKHCLGTRGRCWRPDVSPFHPHYHLHTHQLAESSHPTASTCASTGGCPPLCPCVC